CAGDCRSGEHSTLQASGGRSERLCLRTQSRPARRAAADKSQGTMPDQTTLQDTIGRLADEFPGTAGVCALNLATGEEAAVNDGTSFPTASMIKIMVLFELVRQCT